MTILHVIKYNPSELLRNFSVSGVRWADLLPEPIAKAVSDAIYYRILLNPGVTIAQTIKEVLLEYDGPLE